MSCKWCEMGECWKHTPGGGKATGQGKGKGKGGGWGNEGGGQGGGAQGLVAQLLATLQGGGGGGSGAAWGNAGGSMQRGGAGAAWGGMGGGMGAMGRIGGLGGMGKGGMGLQIAGAGGEKKKHGKRSAEGPLAGEATNQNQKNRQRNKKSRKAAELLGDLPAADPDEVAAFIAAHTLEPHAIERLNALDPKVQTAVLNGGSMETARDQTAMLMSRITAISSTRPGDWVCNNCQEVNFGKNTTCRKCNMLKA